jgi:hypothetical protein
MVTIQPLVFFNYVSFLQKSHENEYRLHKAILEEDLASISLLIDRADVDEVDRKFGFNALHIAIFKRDFNTVLKLVSKSPGLIIRGDVKNWTPLHFSSILGDEKIDNFLWSFEGIDLLEKNTKNNLGATPRDLKDSLKRKSAADDAIVFKFKDGNEQIILGSAHQFKTKIGANFTHLLLPSREGLLSLWPYAITKPTKILAPLFNEINKFSFESNHESISQTYISHINTLIGWGVFALEKIESGSVIHEYTGEMISQAEFQTTEYSQEKVKYAVPLKHYVIDGMKFRNLAAMTNCGFPNAYPCFFYLEDGFPHYFLVALEDIAEGDQICFDYGCEYPCKNRGYQELRIRELKDFIASKSLEEFYRDLLEMKNRVLMTSKFTDLVGFLNLQTKLKYLLQTSAVLFDLLLNNNIDTFSFLQFIEKPDLVELLEMENRVGLLHDIKQCVLNIKKIQALENPNLTQVLKDLIKTKSLPSIQMLIKWFSRELKGEFDCSIIDLEKFSDTYHEISQTIYNSIAEVSINGLEINRMLQRETKAIKRDQSDFIIKDILSDLSEYKKQLLDISQINKIERLESILMNHERIE